MRRSSRPNEQESIVVTDQLLSVILPSIVAHLTLLGILPSTHSYLQMLCVMPIHCHPCRPLLLFLHTWISLTLQALFDTLPQFLLQTVPKTSVTPCSQHLIVHIFVYKNSISTPISHLPHTQNQFLPHNHQYPPNQLVHGYPQYPRYPDGHFSSKTPVHNTFQPHHSSTPKPSQNMPYTPIQQSLWSSPWHERHHGTFPMPNIGSPALSTPPGIPPHPHPSSLSQPGHAARSAVYNHSYPNIQYTETPGPTSRLSAEDAAPRADLGGLQYQNHTSVGFFGERR